MEEPTARVGALQQWEANDELSQYCMGAAFYAGGLYGWMEISVDLTPFEPVLVAGWIGVGGGAAVALMFLVLTRFWRRWLFWRMPSESPPSVADKLSELLIVIASLGGLFVALNCMFVAHGWVTVDGTLPADGLAEASAKYYGWYLLDSIPVLDLTGSFDIETTVSFSGWPNGVLLVTFRALLIAPAVGLLVATLKYERIRHGATKAD